MTPRVTFDKSVLDQERQDVTKQKCTVYMLEQ